jgi:hypothetical protein
MVDIDLNQFRDWVNEAPKQRSCTIEMSPYTFRGHIVWVYDTVIATGQIVQSVAEIDLEGEKRRDMERRLKEAQEYLGRG